MDNAVPHNPSSPYRLYDWLTCRPGMIVGGIVLTPNGFALGDSWNLGHVKEPTSDIPVDSLIEGYVEFRDRLPRVAVTTSGVSVYRPSREQMYAAISEAERAYRTQYRKAAKLVVGDPVGLFLGHLIRLDGCQWTNVLLGNGLDVWIMSS